MYQSGKTGSFFKYNRRRCKRRKKKIKAGNLSIAIGGPSDNKSFGKYELPKIFDCAGSVKKRN
jgi:hypothetical protein